MTSASGASTSISHPIIPLFNGDKYDFWSIKMKTLFKSQELWDLVENVYDKKATKDKLKTNQKKDAKAMLFIHQVVHDSIFTCMLAVETSKDAWTTLQTKFKGSSSVIIVKLQSLRRDFETLLMKNNESMQVFLSRVMDTVSQMKSYGAVIFDENVLANFLRSLTPKYDHVVAAIEESKDLSTFSFDELICSLQAHEARLNKSHDKIEEKAFQVKGGVSLQRNRNSQSTKGQSRGGMAYGGFRYRGGFQGRGGINRGGF